MKGVFLFLSLALLASSCQKQNDFVDKRDYVYRLATVDFDGTKSYSSSSLVITNKEVSKNADDDDDLREFCQRHPEHPKCKLVPVTLEYFKTYIKHGYVIAEWMTSMEYNVKEFQIERSTDGENFITVKTVLPTGAGRYTVTAE